MNHTRNTTRNVSLGLALGLALATLAACDAGDADRDEAAARDTAGAPADTLGVSVADEGLRTPESVLHDPEADVYLVSNINGEPLGRDDNGFISRVSPDGSVEQLKWVDGEADEVTLHAPKGMALKGDTLFVADIDTVRAFHRSSGEPLGAIGIPGADFLNDLTVGEEAVYVSDTGVDASFSATGNAAIYRIGGGGIERVAAGDELSGPNGIFVVGEDLWVVSFGSDEVRRIPLGEGGTGEVVATLPGGQLDGLVVLHDGAMLVSSWETSTVYWVGPDREARAIAEGVPSPADIGYDNQRRRVLIPLFTEDRLEFQPMIQITGEN